jgi:ATP-dependent exoDNAse (exonuclease V) beta subunit
LRDDDGRRPAAHLLATLRNVERDEAEDRRLLYVAATRAREKLLVSAHTSILKSGKLRMAGWLKRLGQVTGLDEVTIDGIPVGMQELTLAEDVGCSLYPWQEGQPPAVRDVKLVMPGAQDVSQDLVAPLVVPPPVGTDPKLSAREADPPRRVWRVVPRAVRPHAPAWVVGTLVHAALRHWRAADEKLSAFLRPLALEAGIVDEALIHNAVVEAARMLRRFQAHPLWAKMDAAQRWHEVPYSVVEGGRPENGIIDLLYRRGGDWHIAEFKTDRLSAGADLCAHIRRMAYDDQVRRYVRALRVQLGVQARASHVFLNVGGQVAVVPAP